MNRRGFLLGAAGLLAAPAIVRVSAIMPVKALPPVVWGKTFLSGVDGLGNPLEVVRDVLKGDVKLTDEGFYHFPLGPQDTSKFAPNSFIALRHLMEIPDHLPSGSRQLVTSHHGGVQVFGPLVRKDSL